MRLSKAALETLAIIAYKQPIIRADVEHIRGVDCGGVLRQLLERKLVRVLGRREIPGRPLIYATTRRFLETFDLKDLKDLPTPKEIEEFGKAPLEGIGNVAIEPDGYAESPAESAGSSLPDGQPSPEAEPPRPRRSRCHPRMRTRPSPPPVPRRRPRHRRSQKKNLILTPEPRKRILRAALAPPCFRALSSAGERYPHTVEVTGSNPVAPTRKIKGLRLRP